MIVLVAGVGSDAASPVVLRHFRRGLLRRFVIEADDDYGLSTGEEFGGVGAFVEVSVHIRHCSGVAGVEPADEVIDVLRGYGRGVGDADEVETDFEGLLFYLFGQIHCFLYYTIMWRIAVSIMNSSLVRCGRSNYIVANKNRLETDKCQKN